VNIKGISLKTIPTRARRSLHTAKAKHGGRKTKRLVILAQLATAMKTRIRFPYSFAVINVAIERKIKPWIGSKKDHASKLVF
jgi:hypothetical protein